MAKDNLNDYEELLSMFEDKKETDTVKPADEETLKTKRQKKNAKNWKNLFVDSVLTWLNLNKLPAVVKC